MNAEVFAEWLRRQGHHVVRTESTYWYDQGPRVYQAFPYHWVIQPSEDELTRFLRRHRAIGLRYSSPLGAPAGRLSYHAVYDRPTYLLEQLDRRSRRNVQVGLKNCTVEPITFERLAEEGWLLESDTEDRQRRRSALRREDWMRKCRAAADLPGFEAWGALVDGRLVASMMTCQVDDCCEMLYQQCLREYLPARVCNALCYVVTKTTTERPGIRSLLYGLQSLDAPASVDEFKFRMGYTAKPVRQRVVFHPWLAPFVGRGAHALLRRALARRPQPALAKAEGMVRFYLEGKLPLQEQAAPPGLEGLLARPAV